MLERVRNEVAGAITAALEAMGVPEHRITLDVPPRRQLGDLAWAGALPLAKALRRPPRAIAEEVARWLDGHRATLPADHPLALLEPGCTIEGPGFLNFRFRRGPFLSHMLQRGVGGRQVGAGGREPAITPGERGREGTSGKVIVEHTNINPNKAAHIGHLRNSVLGDTLVRCLRFLGQNVEVQDYIDDTGVQVADAVVGLLYLPEAIFVASTT